MKPIPAILICLGIPIVPFAVIGELPGEAWLSTLDEGSELFGLTGAGLLALDTLLPIPSTIIGSLLGSRLGFVAGWLWGWLGLMVGNVAGYLAGRFLLWNPSLDLPEHPTALLLLATRPVPVLAEAVAIAAGATRLAPKRFIVATLVGNGIFAGVLAGNGAALATSDRAGASLLLPCAIPIIAWAGWAIYRDQTRLKSPDSR